MTDGSRAALDVSHLPGMEKGTRASLTWGNVLMLAIEGTMFVLVAVTYLYLRRGFGPWPPPTVRLPFGVATGVTLVLLVSCIPEYLASKAAKERDQRKLQLMLLTGATLGVVALALRAWEFAGLNFKWSSHAYGSVVWTALGLHTGHMIAAVTETFVVARWSFRHPIDEKMHLYVELDDLYWYFVVGAWVALYLLIYFVDRPY